MSIGLRSGCHFLWSLRGVGRNPAPKFAQKTHSPLAFNSVNPQSAQAAARLRIARSIELATKNLVIIINDGPETYAEFR